MMNVCQNHIKLFMKHDECVSESLFHVAEPLENLLATELVNMFLV